MARFTRGARPDGSTPDESTSALITRCAREVFPGAEVDERRRRLLVPLPGGRAGIDLAPVTDRLPGHTAAERESIVRSWLAAVTPSLRELRPPDDAAPVAAAVLRLRVMPAWDPSDLPTVVSSPVPHGFQGVVVYPDSDGTPAYLSPRQSQAYGSEDEALRTAVDNTVRDELRGLEHTVVDVDGHALLRFHQPGNPFVSALLMSLRQVLPAGTTDALVVVPSYDEVVLRPVTRRSDVDAVPVLAQVARERHAAAADPCTDRVSWWHEGTLWPLLEGPDGGVVLPGDLRAVVEALPAS